MDGGSGNVGRGGGTPVGTTKGPAVETPAVETPASVETCEVLRNMTHHDTPLEAVDDTWFRKLAFKPPPPQKPVERETLLLPTSTSPLRNLQNLGDAGASAGKDKSETASCKGTPQSLPANLVEPPPEPKRPRTAPATGGDGTLGRQTPRNANPFTAHNAFDFASSTKVQATDRLGAVNEQDVLQTKRCFDPFLRGQTPRTSAAGPAPAIPESNEEEEPAVAESEKRDLSAAFEDAAARDENDAEAEEVATPQLTPQDAEVGEHDPADAEQEGSNLPDPADLAAAAATAATIGL